MICFRKKIITLRALFISMAFMFVGNALTLSSVGIMLKSKGELIAGLVSSFFYIGAIASTIFTKKIVSNLGHLRCYFLFCTIFAIAIILQNLSYSVFYWICLRVVIGFCYYSLVIIIESWLNSKCNDNIRSRVISFYEIIYYICFVLASIILGFGLSNYSIFLLSSILVISALIPLKFIEIKNPPRVREFKISFPSLFILPPLALITALCAGFLANGFLSMGSAYVLLNNRVEDVPVFMSSALLGGFCSFFFIGYISDRWGRRISVILANLIALITCGIILFGNVSFGVEKYIVFFVGFGVFCLYSLALARANDALSDRSKAIVLGSSVLFSYLLASVFSSLILGFIMQTFKGKSFFVFYFLILLILFIIVIFQKKK